MPKITVKCPWPWCPGTQTLDTEDLDFLLDMLTAFRERHKACKPRFKFTVDEPAKPATEAGGE